MPEKKIFKETGGGGGWLTNIFGDSPRVSGHFEPCPGYILTNILCFRNECTVIKGYSLNVVDPLNVTV